MHRCCIILKLCKYMSWDIYKALLQLFSQIHMPPNVKQKGGGGYTIHNIV